MRVEKLDADRVRRLVGGVGDARGAEHALLGCIAVGGGAGPHVGECQRRHAGMRLLGFETTPKPDNLII